MQFKIYRIPLIGNEELTDEMNHFIRTVRILELKKEFVAAGNESFWTFCISYLPVSDPQSKTKFKERIDYKEILDSLSFERFSILRKIRKNIAEKDAVPAYAVFTDAELSEIAKLSTISPTDIIKIEGVSQKKVAKYGEVMCERFKEAIKTDETGRLFNGENTEL